MKSTNNQMNYWDSVAHEKTFTHPLAFSLLTNLVNKDSIIIDYGCGYGRLVEMLNSNGYNNVKGFDTSMELIKRGNNSGVKNIFFINSPQDLPIENNSVDCILLFAILTCIPDNQSQKELIEILNAKLKKGCIIYISDYYLQTDSTEVKQYEYWNNDQENFGVFTLPEGAIFRHHTHEWMGDLLQSFDITKEVTIEVKTMNGNSAEAFQIIGTKK